MSMQELARLMEELTLALKARAEASNRTEALAKEVQDLPKLSVLAPFQSSPVEEDASENDSLLKLQLQLELQDLRHSKQEGLDTLDMAARVVQKMRETVNKMETEPVRRGLEPTKALEFRIQVEKGLLADYQQRKQDLLFDLSQELAKLVELQNKLP